MRLVGWVLLFAGLLLLWPLLGPIVVGLIAALLLFPLLLGSFIVALVLAVPVLFLVLGVIAARVLLPFLLIGLGVWLLTGRRQPQAAGA